MITVHPQRWNDNIFNWTKELVTQSGKNVIKKYFFVKRQGENVKLWNCVIVELVKG